MIEIKLIFKDVPGGGACSLEVFSRAEGPTPVERKAHRYFDRAITMHMHLFLAQVGAGEMLEGHFSDELAAAAIERWRQRIARERGGK